MSEPLRYYRYCLPSSYVGNTPPPMHVVPAANPSGTLCGKRLSRLVLRLGLVPQPTLWTFSREQMAAARQDTHGYCQACFSQAARLSGFLSE